MVPIPTWVLAAVLGAAAVWSGPSEQTGGQPDGRAAALEARLEQAVAERDFGRAKALDLGDRDQGIEGWSRTTDAPRSRDQANEPWNALHVTVLPSDFVGPDFVVDTVAVRAFGAATDDSGAIWVAAAGCNTRVRVYRSLDFGRTWQEVLEFGRGVDVSKIEVVCGPGDSSFVYVFYLIGTGDGDLRVMRVEPRGLSFQDFAVAAGPDTVNDFSVCADRDRHHYLYCLYANEMRAGRTGNFTRSLDFAKTWEVTQPWWNCWDPHVTYGSGSTIHCAWRYAATGRAIHQQSNRYYGRVRQWWPLHVVSGTSRQCRDPVVAQADTAREWQATVWVGYTAARRDTQRLDLELAYSNDGGINWATGLALGDPFYDDWFADLAAAPGSAAGYVYMCYNSGGSGPGRNTTVRLRSANAYEPSRWSAPLKMNDPRASAQYEGCRPRVVCPRGAPRQWAGVLFSYYDPEHGAGLYFDAPWNSDFGNAGRPANPGPGLRLVVSGLRLDAAVARAGVYTIAVYDPAGRLVRTLHAGTLDPGERRFEWDGRDGSGSPVPAGIYPVVASGPDGRCGGRFLVLH